MTSFLHFLFRNAYNLVLHNYGDMLYRGVRNCVKERLEVICQEVIKLCLFLFLWTDSSAHVNCSLAQVSQAIDSRFLEVLKDQVTRSFLRERSMILLDSVFNISVNLVNSGKSTSWWWAWRGIFFCTWYAGKHPLKTHLSSFKKKKRRVALLKTPHHQLKLQLFKFIG